MSELLGKVTSTVRSWLYVSWVEAMVRHCHIAFIDWTIASSTESFESLLTNERLKDKCVERRFTRRCNLLLVCARWIAATCSACSDNSCHESPSFCARTTLLYSNDTIDNMVVVLCAVLPCAARFRLSKPMALDFFLLELLTIFLCYPTISLWKGKPAYQTMSFLEWCQQFRTFLFLKVFALY